MYLAEKVFKPNIVSAFLLSLLVLPACKLTDSDDETPIDREISFTHELITDELEYPWQLAFAGDDRIFVTEVKGQVRVFENEQFSEEPWFDLTTYMQAEGLTFPGATDGGRQRSGLQGIAVDPDFDDNGYVYIGFAYHIDEQSYDYNRLLKLRENPLSRKGEVVEILLDSVPGYDLHQAAQIKFGPDGKLYWSTADRFEEESSQDLNDLSGKILRMNSDGTIPDDNPFPDSYVYSYGHRNPQGFSWQKETNLMMATEHGPSGNQGCCRDELNIIEAGKNYGWPTITGYETGAGLVTPVFQSGNEPENSESVRDSTWAPSGATFVHSGPWKDTFLFTGLRSRTLFQVTFDKDNNPDEVISLIDTHEEGYFRARSVDQAPNGDIYMITSNMDRTYDPQYNRTDYLVKINVFYVDE